MAGHSENPDRDLLKPRRAFWTDDPEQNLTEAELDLMLRYFGTSENAQKPDLRSGIKRVFQTFIVMAKEEGFIEVKGRLKKAPKPSTRVERDVQKLSEAGGIFYRQLAGLDSVTRSWLDQYIAATGSIRKINDLDRLQDLDDLVFGLTQSLDIAARHAEGLVSRGPNYTALRVMIENLAECWEICHTKPPTTDKGRGRRDDPFLELCQEMASIANIKLQKKGGGLGSLQLSGLVADVVEKRRTKSTTRLREK